MCVDSINDVIQSVLEEYAALPYETEHITRMPRFDIQFTIFDQIFLDVFVMKIRTKTMSFASTKKRANEEKEKGLQNCILSLETKLNLTEDERTQLAHYQQELTSIREHKMEDVLLQSRAKWVKQILLWP